MTKNITISPNGPVSEFMQDLEGCEGKTIKSVHEECVSWNDYLVVRFTDGSAMVMRQQEDSDNWTASGETFKSSYSENVRVYFGMEDAAAYAAKLSKQDADRASQTEAQERAQFEALKRKFETSK